MTQILKDFQVQKEISNVKYGLLPTDCQGTFTPECQRKIKAESKEVGIIQCWGQPLYAYCKASDGTVFHIPGYDCEHSTCPNDSKAEKIPDIEQSPIREAPGDGLFSESATADFDRIITLIGNR